MKLFLSWRHPPHHGAKKDNEYTVNKQELEIERQISQRLTANTVYLKYVRSAMSCLVVSTFCSSSSEASRTRFTDRKVRSNFCTVTWPIPGILSNSETKVLRLR